MASKAMWEVDPETRSKVRNREDKWRGPVPIHVISTSIASNRRLTHHLSNNTASRHPKRIRELSMLRLQCPFAAMGLPEVRHIHLPQLRRCPSRPGRAHFLRKIHLHGRLQTD